MVPQRGVVRIATNSRAGMVRWCAITSLPAGVTRFSASISTMPCRSSSSSASARAACSPRRTQPGRRGFAAFLYGVVRNVALRFEAKQFRADPGVTQEVAFDDLPAPGETFSRLFDRSWAKAMVREAAALQVERAAESGGDAARRSELLRLRFFDGLPIREIARRWGTDPAVVHHEYAKARTEFRKALGDVVAFDHPGSPEEIEARCHDLLSLLNRA